MCKLRKIFLFKCITLKILKFKCRIKSNNAPSIIKNLLSIYNYEYEERVILITYGTILNNHTLKMSESVAFLNLPSIKLKHCMKCISNFIFIIQYKVAIKYS